MATPDLPAAAAAIEAFLRALGHPPESDPELVGTGARVAEAFSRELLAGYALDPATVLADATAAVSSAAVVLAGIETTVICPHHLLPAPGVVHLGYVPSTRVVGLGALARLVDCLARRLVLQEPLTDALADALVTHLDARAAGAVVSLRPTCVTARGSRQHGAVATTFAFRGAVDESFRSALLAGAQKP